MPPTTSTTAPSFQVRVSTVFLGAALTCLALALPLNLYSERHAASRADLTVTILVYAVFPIAVIAGCLSAFILLFWRPRWQFVAELVVGFALLYWLSRWEPL